jgi:glycosyltransferase involved in cell wall biosynthesis
MKKQLLILGLVWPEPNSSAAGSRMIKLIELFLHKNWKITFASAAQKSEYSYLPNDVNIETATIQVNDSSFDQWISGINFDVVLFDRFIMEEQFGWRVAEFCPNAIRILDTEDLHFLRHARHQALNDGLIPKEINLQNDHAKREIASILRCDISLIISSFEIQLLQKEFLISKDLLHYLPFKTAFKRNLNLKPFEERTDFVSIGNFFHAPNLDAVKILKKLLWLPIRKSLPHAKLHIYGAYISQQVLEMHDEKNGFIVHGRAEDAKEEISNAKALLAPLRFGAGLKGKLLDAMETGTPSVTTSIGAEGMTYQNKWNGLIADNAEAFIQSAIALYSDKEIWESSQKTGIEIIEHMFSKQDHENEFVVEIDSLLDSSVLAAHRKKNFMGSMLMHHTSQGTKYMSKWIELKNQTAKKLGNSSEDKLPN